MRNLKRALSLTLASVMLLGMMVVGSSAAAGYDDVKDTDNVEAIEVLQAVEVMVGDDRGFGPDRPVTRNEMAVVMGKLLNLNYNYYSSTCPFTDVAEWAKGWVGACAANGIVSGRGNGIYDGEATVTAIEAASMMMRALGYFKYTEDYADGFQVVTVRQGSQIGIFNGVGTDANTPMTRNQVAQMALNALQANMVNFTGTPSMEVNGVKVGYRAQYDFRSGTDTKYSAISNQGNTTDKTVNQSYIQLGEELYDGKLKLNEFTTDSFGRPARHWEYDGKAIGTYAKTELLRAEYTTEVTGKQLYDLLTKPTIDSYDFYVAIDGEWSAYQRSAFEVKNSDNDIFSFNQGNLIRTNTKAVGGTGNGVLTQVYVDPNESNSVNGRGVVYISVINTYLAKATNDYDSKREEAKFDVYALEDMDPSTSAYRLVKNTNDNVTPDKAYVTNLTVKNEDINVEDVKNKDIVLVRVAEGEIKEIFAPEVIAETEISSFKNGSWVNNGTKYDYASAAGYDPDVLDDYVEDNMKDTTYNLYLDKYGYLVGVDIVEAKANYVFLTGIDGRTSNLRNKTAEGNVIHLDGTMETVSIKLSDSRYANGADMTDSSANPLNSLMNTWCKYTTNKNGDYVLTEVAKTAAKFDAKGNKAGQSHVDETTASATTFANYGTIDKKHVSTKGITDSASTVKVAYGTDDSVYLNVSTGLITADRVSSAIPGPNAALIIDDVNSVTVGVQQANLKALTAYQVWNTASNHGTIGNTTPDSVGDIDPDKLDSVAHGVYNLFDKDGAVIAAVVVGEDNGSTSNYAYVISDKMEQESFDKEDEEYTWIRKVVINGEITEVKEITDGKHPAIENMTRGQWYKMKYKSDGTVKSAELIGWDEDRNDTVDNGPSTLFNDRGTVVGEFFADADDSANEFIGLVRKVENSVVAHDTVVLATDLTGRNPDADGVSVPNAADSYSSIRPGNTTPLVGKNIITASGNTLWIENKVVDQKDGFAVRNDAKVVLVQDTHTIKNGSVIKTNVMANQYEYSVTGKEALSRMVKDLMDNENFSGFISAVFEGGVATSVVIWDQTPEDIDTGDDPINPPVVDNDTMEIRVYVTKDGVPDGHIYESWTVTRATNVAIPAPNVGAQWVPDTVLQPAPAFVKDGIKSVTFNYTDLSAGGTYTGTTTRVDDKGDAASAGITEELDKVTLTKDPGTGMATGDMATALANVVNKIKELAPGVYEYTNELKEKCGWTYDGGGNTSSPIQIGPDTNPADVRLFIFKNTTGAQMTGYSIVIDDVEVASGTSLTWADDSVHFFNLQIAKTGTTTEAPTVNLAKGIHSYKILDQDDHVVQFGTFEV